MTQEDKQLLLVDLCARLPYGVKITDGLHITTLKVRIDTAPATLAQFIHSDNLRYYLRPMSSMTAEEKEELLNHVLGGEGAEYFHIAHDGSIDGNQEAEQDLYNLNLHWLNFGPLTTASYIDWLNKKMFDFRGLIPKGLAISTEEFNPYKD